MLQMNDQMLGMFRTAARSAIEMTNILLSGTERMLSRQAEISRQIRADCADAAKEIETAAEAQDLVSVQGRLVRTQLEKAVTYWAGLYAEVGASQRDLMHQAQAATLDMIEELGRALDGVAPAPGTEPVVSAMKLVVDATRSSYAASAGAVARAAEPGAPQAAPPVPATKGGTKQAAG